MFTDDYDTSSKKWWESRRINYNLGLAISGVLAFIAYAVLAESLMAPYIVEYEITLFTIGFQGIGYLFMMGVANLFYFFGNFFDEKYNKNDSEIFRRRLYNSGFWFSCLLPFLIPIFVIIQYLIIYRK